jgi:hypothetical protein
MTPMQPEPLANSICIRREDPLVVPPQNSDRRIAIRVSDWRRIKAKLSRAAAPAKTSPEFTMRSSASLDQPSYPRFQSLWRVVSPPGWCRCMSALSFLARLVDG